MSQGSKIFERNKALGYVSNHVPLAVRYIKSRTENLVVTSVGRCFHTYGCNTFNLLSVSGLHSSDISCLAADSYHIYTSCGTEIYAWRRGTELRHTYKGHQQPVHIIVPLGCNLLSVDESSVMKVWDIKTEEQILEFPFSNETFQISTLLHPSTYLNKVLLGSKQGTLQLLNIHTSKLIYTFRGWDCEITVLEQAPAIDVVAIGLANGRIILLNIRYDESLMELQQDWGLVTHIAFRTDGSPIMATGSLAGHIILWNLEEKKPLTQIEFAHNGAVAGMKCLPNEPLMITSSPDNSLKLWIFDMPDGGGRLLRLREGHSRPPTFIRYHGNNGENILSAGDDSCLRMFSTVTEILNKSLGVASYNRKAAKRIGRKQLEESHLKMPPVIHFTSETVREKEWDNIAAMHLGLNIVTTWSYGKCKMGELKLVPDKFQTKLLGSTNKITATCLCLTSCGNFVVIGYSSGDIYKFNVQSGMERGTYGCPAAHTGPVRGVATDGLNQIVVSGGSDSSIKFWRFKTGGGGMLSQLDLEDPVIFFNVHRESSLLAVALENYQVLVLDMDTRIVIRKFGGHSTQLTDVTFSPDARWLITASMDCTIRTWDIPSAHLIDMFQVDAPCTSLTFSPTGDRLATTHVNYVGVYLWSNRTLFDHVSLHPVLNITDIPMVSLPTTAETMDEIDDADFEDSKECQFKSPEQISEDLVTLSQVSNSRWQNLLNIDIIRKKNKPKQLLNKPRSAPFFLPTIPSLDLQFDLNKEISANKENDTHPLQVKNVTVFGKMLLKASETNDYQEAVEKLKQLGPSAVDFEVGCMAPEDGGSFEIMGHFMDLIESLLVTNKDFELAQSYLALFVKKHGDIIAAKPQFCQKLQLLQSFQEDSWHTLQNKFLYSLCIVESLKSM